MRIFAASFLAMSAGWGVLNTIVLIIALMASGTAGAVSGGLGFIAIFGVVSAVVVGVAWLVIYLPVYALVPRECAFWHWGVCVPVGVVVGAVAPWITTTLSGGAVTGWLNWALLAPALVGGVAAAVGRWLVDWSRHYKGCHEYHPEHGRRVPWLRA